MKRPKNSAYVRGGEIRIYLLGITDDEAEYKRIKKILVKLEKQISIKQAKLSDEKFLTRAKKEIIEGCRNDLQELLFEQKDLMEYISEVIDSLSDSEGD